MKITRQSERIEGVARSRNYVLTSVELISIGPLLIGSGQPACQSIRPEAGSNAMKWSDGSPAKSSFPAVVR